VKLTAPLNLLPMLRIVVLYLHPHVFGERDSSVLTATGYGLDSRGSIPGTDKSFSLFYSVLIGRGTHPAYYPMGTEGSFPGSKVTETHSRPSTSEVKNGGAIPPLSHTSSRYGA
jgi:hypothetical protein